MQSLTLCQRVGEDGILHLDATISEGLEWKEFIEKTYGSSADDPIVIDDEGISALLDEKMEGVAVFWL